MKTESYHVLGLSKNASIKQIKKRYRELVKQYHPDKNSSGEAKSKFLEIQQAYDTLLSADPPHQVIAPSYPEQRPSKNLEWSNMKTYSFVFLLVSITSILGLFLYFFGIKEKLHKAQQAYILQDYPTAKEYLFYLLEDDATHLEGNLLMTKILLEEKDPLSLIYALTLSKQEVKNPIIFTNLAIAYLLNGDDYHAEIAAFEALSMNEIYDSANFLMGFISIKKGEKERAKKYLSKIQNPKNIDRLWEMLKE